VGVLLRSPIRRGRLQNKAYGGKGRTEGLSGKGERQVESGRIQRLLSFFLKEMGGEKIEGSRCLSNGKRWRQTVLNSLKKTGRGMTAPRGEPKSVMGEKVCATCSGKII